MVRAPLLVEGNTDILIIGPSSPKGASPTEQGGEDEEQIVAVALWLPPGVMLEL